METKIITSIDEFRNLIKWSDSNKNMAIDRLKKDITYIDRKNVVGDILRKLQLNEKCDIEYISYGRGTVITSYILKVDPDKVPILKVQRADRYEFYNCVLLQLWACSKKKIY